MLPSTIVSRIVKRDHGLDGANLPYRDELDAAIAAALAAGEVVRAYYDGATTATYEKRDGSPVTDADLAADKAIRDVLSDRFPNDPILSEEGQDDERRLEHARCWIVDPLDGTEQFIHRTGEFDVLVALIENGGPVAAAGYQPTTGTLVTATFGGGAWLRRADGPPERIHFAPAGDEIRLATSKWFGAPENEDIVRAVAKCLGIAPARATITGFTPRMFLAPRAFDVMIGVRPGEDQTMASEWDFAVADLVFHEAGGVVTDLDGRRFQYNKPVPRNEGGLIAAVDPATHARVIAAARARCASSPSG
jgi:3'-phosphoadenosine 5'-phosphosulfate (PAPS) 3'-phosphatase